MAQTVIVTSKDDDCEIDDWLNKHNLQNEKYLFVEHNMDTVNNLSLRNKNFGALITDHRLVFQSDTVQRIIAAIQSLEKEQQEKEKQEKLVIITVSEKENETMEQLQEYIDKMKKLQSESKQIHADYDKKVILNSNTMKQYQTKCLHELNEINNQINGCISKLKELLKQKEASLTKEITIYQRELIEQKSNDLSNINGIDDTLHKYSNAINEAIQHFKSKIVECKNIITKYSPNMNDDRLDEYHGLTHNGEREKNVIEVGKNAKIDFTNRVKEMNTYETQINEFVNEDENKGCEDTNVAYPWAIHINESLYKEIKNDIKSCISISVHSKYENNNITEQTQTIQKFETQLQCELSRRNKLQLQMTKLSELNKSNEKLIDRLQQKRDTIHEKVKRYQSQIEEKKPIESKSNVQYVPLSDAKSRCRKFDINDSKLWNISSDRTSIKSCYDDDHKINSQLSVNKGSVIYASVRSKNGYKSGIHTWSVQQRNAIGIRSIGVTSKKTYDKVEFESYLDGYSPPWKSGEIVHIVINCNKWVVTFYKTDRHSTTKIVTQKISCKKSYYFVLVVNPFNCSQSQEYISVPTTKYINVIKRARRKSLNEKKADKRRKSKVKCYSSDGDAEEMKHEYRFIDVDKESNASLGVGSLSPKSVKSDDSRKARYKPNRKSFMHRRSASNKRSKSKGAKQVAKGYQLNVFSWKM